MKNHIVIAGGTGFLGNALEMYFQSKNTKCLILTRNPTKTNHVYWNGKTLGNWITALNHSKALINLAGKSVNCRYTAKNKNLILNSRIETTHILNEAISQVDYPPNIWINSSTATIYIHSLNQKMCEINGIIGNDFSMNVAKQWEKEFFKKSFKPIRKVAIRTSIVLGNSGGAFPLLKKLTTLGMGGKQGSGKQKVSWIHIEDYARAIHFMIENKTVKGSINLTAPEPTNNYKLMKTLRESLNKTFGIQQPTWLLKIGAVIIKTETELILKSRNVVPKKLLQEGFKFNHPKIKPTINDLIHDKNYN